MPKREIYTLTRSSLAKVNSDTIAALVHPRCAMLNEDDFELGLAYAWVKGHLDWIKPETKPTEIDYAIPMEVYDELRK